MMDARGLTSEEIDARYYAQEMQYIEDPKQLDSAWAHWQALDARAKNSVREKQLKEQEKKKKKRS